MFCVLKFFCLKIRSSNFNVLDSLTVQPPLQPIPIHPSRSSLFCYIRHMPGMHMNCQCEKFLFRTHIITYSEKRYIYLYNTVCITFICEQKKQQRSYRWRQNYLHSCVMIFYFASSFLLLFRFNFGYVLASEILRRRYFHIDCIYLAHWR